VGCKKINGKGKIQARGNPERLCFSFRVYENSSREKLMITLGTKLDH